MKSKYPKIALLGFLALSIIIALNHYLNPNNAVKLILPDLASLNYLEANIENDTAFFTLFGIVQNQSFFDLNIDTIKYKIDVEKQSIVAESGPLDLHLKPGESDTFRLKIKVSVQKIKFVSDEVKTNDSLNVGCDFEIVYQYLQHPFRIKYSKSQKIKSPTPPKIEITEVKRKEIKKLGKEIVMDVVLFIENNSKKVTFDLEKINYTIALGDHIYSEGIIKNRLLINPGEKKRIVVPINLKVKKPLRTAIDLFWKKESINYEIKISAVANNEEVRELKKPIIKFSAKGVTKIK